MNWAIFLQSAVLAAIVSGVVGLIGARITARTAVEINQKKLILDKQLAEYRVDAEIKLEEKKVELDRNLAIAKRRAQLAENVLADFYQARRVLEIVRSPMIWAAEMIEEVGVDQDIITNDGYGVIR